MKEPESKQEYESRYAKNTIITGYGDQTRTIFPCPFCAAPDCYTWYLFDMDFDKYDQKITCNQCDRSFKWIVNRNDNSIQIEMVQTGGKEAPPWVPMRRVQ